MTSAEAARRNPDVAIHKITKFFYFTLSNEIKIIEASSRALTLYEKNYKLVPSLQDVWKIFKKDRQSGQTSIEVTEPIFGVSLDQWNQFKKMATDEEVFIITLVLIDLDIHSIAEGLDLSKGTIAYRINRALIKLGNLLENGI